MRPNITDRQRAIIPAADDIAGQTEIWEHLKRWAPNAYMQATINHEQRIGESR